MDILRLAIRNKRKTLLEVTPLKETLRGMRYYDLHVDDLELEVARQVRHVNSGCLATGIRDLQRCRRLLMSMVGIIVVLFVVCIFYFYFRARLFKASLA